MMMKQENHKIKTSAAVLRLLDLNTPKLGLGSVHIERTLK